MGRAVGPRGVLCDRSVRWYLTFFRSTSQSDTKKNQLSKFAQQLKCLSIGADFFTIPEISFYLFPTISIMEGTCSVIQQMVYSTYMFSAVFLRSQMWPVITDFYIRIRLFFFLCTCFVRANAILITVTATGN